jgi:hypothetical protein
VARLRSDIWVAAYLRRCASEGASAVLRRRGSAEAGTVFVKVDSLDGRAAIYGLVPQSVDGSQKRGFDRVFARTHEPEWIDSREADRRLDREVAFDPDLWIVEVEDRDGRTWLDMAQ